MKANGILEKLMAFLSELSNAIELLIGQSIPKSVAALIVLLGVLTAIVFLAKILFAVLRRMRIANRRINRLWTAIRRAIELTWERLRLQITECKIRRTLTSRKVRRARIKRLTQG